MPHDSLDGFRRFGSKLDSRLLALLSMDTDRRIALKRHERTGMSMLAARLREAVHGVRTARKEMKPQALERLKGVHASLFAPMTTGFFDAGDVGAAPTIAETHISVFIVSDASVKDLADLGAQVRSQAGDIVTAFIPLSALPRLMEAAAVRHVELARPLYPSVNAAVQFAQIDQLRTGSMNFTGQGMIVGVLDSTLDIYHPDFRDENDRTRVRCLWDQTLTAQGTERTPQAYPYGGWSPTPAYGVEYDRNDINRQLTAGEVNPAAAYSQVRHNAGGEDGSHGTAVAGIAVGNGRASGAGNTANIGAAPGADLIFVSHPDLYTNEVLADITQVADGFRYVFERAAQLNMPCVVNLSDGDNLGPHDGTSCGELFIDALLEVPGRAITLSAGNSTGTRSHARGQVTAGGTTRLTLTCHAGASKSDAVQIWYDGHDRLDATVSVPTAPAPIVASAGDTQRFTWPNGLDVLLRCGMNHPGNGDHFIDVLFTVPPGCQIPSGDITIDLHGAAVANGNFHAWVDRNNRPEDWSFPNNPPKLHFTDGAGTNGAVVDDATLTLGTPGTARRPITVGNHDQSPAPVIAPSSGLGPTRDGRVKPEIAAVGVNVPTTYSNDRRQTGYTSQDEYDIFNGTSASAPLVAGACAALFQCRGPNTTWAHLKQIFEDTAGTVGMAIPNNRFGFGYVQIGTGCSIAAPQVDVWLRHDGSDTGQEPFTGPIAWISPDIEVLDMAGNPVANPSYAAGGVVNNMVRVTVRNRGSQIARNTEVSLYWADPATNVPFGPAWKTSGIFKDVIGAGFVDQHNSIVVPQLGPGQIAQLDFGWAPPAPGGHVGGGDHFCLLVRLENQADPSGLDSSSWNDGVGRNNVALRNVHVQPMTASAPIRMAFHAVGTSERDSLVVTPDLAGGTVQLILSLGALPWRECRTVDMLPGRLPYPGRAVPDPLRTMRRTLDAEEAAHLTGIRNALEVAVAGGVATITLDGTAPLLVPDLRLEYGAALPCSVAVSGAQVQGSHRYVHVAQRSGGRLVGGVSLELR